MKKSFFTRLHQDVPFFIISMFAFFWLVFKIVMPVQRLVDIKLKSNDIIYQSSAILWLTLLYKTSSILVLRVEFSTRNHKKVDLKLKKLYMPPKKKENKGQILSQDLSRSMTSSQI